MFFNVGLFFRLYLFSIGVCVFMFFFAVRDLRDELQFLLEPASYVGEVVKAMGKTKVLVKVNTHTITTQSELIVVVLLSHVCLRC